MLVKQPTRNLRESTVTTMKETKERNEEATDDS